MDRWQFRSFNFPDHFIRHQNFLGELSTLDALTEDFLFLIILAGQQRQVVLRSVNFPDRYLRHRNFRIMLEAPSGPGDQLFRQDAIFHMDEGLADPNGISFRSSNFPDRYLRHRDFHLWAEPLSSPNLAPDATFHQMLPPVLIDPGTATEPADA